jgi:hypothetical protein
MHSINSRLRVVPKRRKLFTKTTSFDTNSMSNSDIGLDIPENVPPTPRHGSHQPLNQQNSDSDNVDTLTDVCTTFEYLTTKELLPVIAVVHCFIIIFVAVVISVQPVPLLLIIAAGWYCVTVEALRITIQDNTKCILHIMTLQEQYAEDTNTKWVYEVLQTTFTLGKIASSTNCAIIVILECGFLLWD